jgi:hypothetical protein
MMIGEDLARISAHRNNIHRYRSLLKTRLSDLERQFIERRLSEESAALEALSSGTFPIAFNMAPRPPAPTRIGAVP